MTCAHGAPVPLSQRTRQSLLLLLALVAVSHSEHPCEAEVTAACPDSPPAEIAACLKDPSQHETPTVLSSGCTDFVALNTACAGDIEKFCDEAFFTEDTTLCLKSWTDPGQLSEKCAGVMSWAIPKGDDEIEDGPTDELGMSDKEREELREWQAKRRSERSEAIKRMKEVDATKEAERVELEKFKREHPEEYEAMIQQEEENKRQAQEQKKKERLIQAALERKKKEAAGVDPDSEEEAEERKLKKKKRKRTAPAPPPPPPREQGSKLTALLCLVFVGAVCAGGYFLLTRMAAENAKTSSGKIKKKKA